MNLRQLFPLPFPHGPLPLPRSASIGVGMISKFRVGDRVRVKASARHQTGYPLDPNRIATVVRTADVDGPRIRLHWDGEAAPDWALAEAELYEVKR
jgi:hypothetical protein